MADTWAYEHLHFSGYQHSLRENLMEAGRRELLQGSNIQHWSAPCPARGLSEGQHWGWARIGPSAF